MAYSLGRRSSTDPYLNGNRYRAGSPIVLDMVDCLVVSKGDFGGAVVAWDHAIDVCLPHAPGSGGEQPQRSTFGNWGSPHCWSRRAIWRMAGVPTRSHSSRWSPERREGNLDVIDARLAPTGMRDGPIPECRRCKQRDVATQGKIALLQIPSYKHKVLG